MSVVEVPRKVSSNPSQTGSSSSSSASSSSSISTSASFSSSDWVCETLDNGGNPFRVSMQQKDQRIVVTIINNEDAAADSAPLVLDFSAVLIGKSPVNKMTTRSLAHGPAFDGNSVLVKLSRSESQLTYVFIGDRIFKFEAKAKIKEFVSPVGNNAVPYPYAVDESGHYYLLGERVIVKSDAAQEKATPAGSNSAVRIEDCPYEWYYALSAAQRQQHTEELTVIVVCARESAQFSTHHL